MAVTSTLSTESSVVPQVVTWKQPSHPDLIKVIDDSADLSSSSFSKAAFSLVDLPPGALFTPITGEPADEITYTTYKTSRTTQNEFMSDLVFINHGCEPSLIFDVTRMEVRVNPDRRDSRGQPRGLQRGDVLTFFYPSTEWHMVQPFDCCCGSSACLGRIEGAGAIPTSVLSRYWVNAHIRDMLEERDAKVNDGNHGKALNGHAHGKAPNGHAHGKALNGHA